MSASHRSRLTLTPLEDRITPVTLPPGFNETVLVDNLERPAALELTPDGRMLVILQNGQVRLVDENGLRPDPLLTVPVADVFESGMSGLVLHPDFARNGHLYLYFTVPDVNGFPAFNRVSRFTMTGDAIDPASERIIVDLDPVKHPNHNGGAMRFGADGKLYVATGDNIVRANSQSLDTRHGKILRYNPDGSIPDDNPTSFDGLAGTTTGVNRAIWAVGFRNPFTFAIHPDTGELYVNDVGQDSFEEVNVVTAGKNYGWPATEGFFDPAEFPHFTNPLVSLPHGFNNDTAKAVIGAVFYPTGLDGGFPAEYQGNFLFGDYVNRWIRRIDGGTLEPELFASGLTYKALLDMDVAANGDLIYLSRNTFGFSIVSEDGAIAVIRFTDQPGIAAQPKDATSVIADPATFAVIASGDGPYTYQWLKDGVPIPGATRDRFTVARPFPEDAGAYSVVVSNPNGSVTSRAAILTVTNDRPPLGSILFPATDLLFEYGSEIAYSGIGLDVEDGQMGPAAYQWTFQYITGRAAPRPLSEAEGVLGGTFSVPSGSPYTKTDVKVRITLTLTDSFGNKTSVTRELLPRVAQVNIGSSLPGVPLLLDEVPAPRSGMFDTVVGQDRLLGAPTTVTQGGTEYRFIGWSDGNPNASRLINGPIDGGFQAMYAVVTPAVPNAGPGRLTALPDGFSETVAADGLTRPTAMLELPDGRLLVAEQTGAVRVVNGGGLVSAPALTLTVDPAGERGLLGLALDPNFAANGFVYLYHTVPAAGSNPAFNRVSRGTLVGNTIDPASRITLVDLDPLSAATNHNGGALLFGADGKLYVATGENANPPLAQSLASRHGKILRYNPDGSIPSDNPTSFAGLTGTTTGANRAIWAVGFRNPFTFAVQPGTGRIFVNDVGQNSFEEVNELTRGANYGWPGTEGDFDPAAFPTFTRPLVSYAHGTGNDRGRAIGGAAFYNPATNTFPSAFTGRYFYGDIVNGWIRLFDPATGEDLLFASNITVAAVVDLDVSANGDLLYLARGDGSTGAGAVYRIRFTEVPGIAVPPADVTIRLNEDATFRVTATGTTPLTYQWQRNGIDIPGATGTSYTLVNAQPSDGGARFRVVVRNEAGEVFSPDALLFVGDNQLPRATILGPAAGLTFVAGQTFDFRGQADDPEDGVLTAAAFSWRVDYITGGLVRPFVPETPGITSGSFTIPVLTPFTQTDVLYRIVLTVRDKMGAMTTVTRDLLPVTATVALRTDPGGAALTLDGQPVGDTFTGVSGVRRQLTAPATIERNGGVWRFVGWSDGVTAADRTFDTPTANSTLEAIYRPAPAVAVAGAGGLVTLLDPLTNTVVGRFDLSARFAGGARVAMADVNGDGIPDLVVGSAPGGPPVVAVYDGRTGAELGVRMAFESTFTGGVFVAAGDLTGDGRAEIIVSPDEGGGPRVLVLAGADLDRVLADFFGIDDPNFRGGARVAVGDMTGDGRADLIVSAGFGGGPRVAGFDGGSVAAGDPRKVFADFFAFETALRNGTFVSVGDMDGDGRADLVLGAGPGGGPRVLVLNGASLLSTGEQVPLLDFFAGDPNARGGVRVAARDLDGDGRAELAAGTAPGTADRVSVYRPSGELLAELTPFDEDFGGGVFVG